MASWLFFLLDVYYRRAVANRQTMSGRQLVAALAASGAAALLFIAAVSFTAPVVELGSSSRAAGFAQAAHSARSWAAQAFANQPPAKAAVQARIVAAAIADVRVFVCVCARVRNSVCVEG